MTLTPTPTQTPQGWGYTEAPRLGGRRGMEGPQKASLRQTKCPFSGHILWVVVCRSKMIFAARTSGCTALHFIACTPLGRVGVHLDGYRLMIWKPLGPVSSEIDSTLHCRGAIDPQSTY